MLIPFLRLIDTPVAIYCITSAIRATAAVRCRDEWVDWPWQQRQPRPSCLDVPLSDFEHFLLEEDLYFANGLDLLHPPTRKGARGRGNPRVGMSWDRQRRRLAGQALLQNGLRGLQRATDVKADLKNLVAGLVDLELETGLGLYKPASVNAGEKVLTWVKLAILERSLVAAEYLPTDWYYSGFACAPKPHLLNEEKLRRRRLKPISKLGFSIDAAERERMKVEIEAAAAPREKHLAGIKHARYHTNKILRTAKLTSATTLANCMGLFARSAVHPGDRVKTP